MSRSGYSEDGDFDQWSMIRWRGAVTSAIRGKRGQALLRDALAALDAMPEQRLIAEELRVVEANPLLPWLFARVPDPDDWGLHSRYHDHWPIIALPRHAGVCLLGVVGDARGLATEGLDPADSETVAATFDIADPLAREIVFQNDVWAHTETPEQRWLRMRTWVVSNLRPSAPDPQTEGDISRADLNPLAEE